MPVDQLSVTGLVSEISNGNDWWRTILPFRRLKACGYNVRATHHHTRLAVKPDVLVVNRLGYPNDSAAEQMQAVNRQTRTLLVCDQDDCNWQIPAESPFHRGPELHENTLRGIRHADLVTVTTEVLAERVREYNPHVAVLPNLIEPEDWRGYRFGARLTKHLTIGMHGGDSHAQDWEMVCDLFPRLAERYPDLRFVVAGSRPPWLAGLANRLGSRLVIEDWAPVDRYQRLVATIDIGLCPLQATAFNRCKSPIKWIEHSMLGRATVVSPTLYGDYVEHGQTALVADHSDDWYLACCWLIEDYQLRRRIGRQAYERVLAHHSLADSRQLQRRMHVYRRAFDRVFGGSDGKLDRATPDVAWADRRAGAVV